MVKFGESISTTIMQSGFFGSIDKLINDYYEFGIVIGIILLIILIYVNNNRIKAERRYRIFELNYKAFLQASQDIIFKFSKTGIIEEFYTSNPEKLFRPLEELLGKNIFDVLPESFVDKIYNAVQECLSEDRIITIEYTFNYKDNPKILEEARFVKIDSDHVIVVIRDITDRKTTLSQLQKLQRTFEQAMDEIAVVNMEGYIEFVNKAWADAHGYSVEELVGKHLSIFHTNEQHDIQVIPFNKILMEKGFSRGEVDHKRKDGSVFPTFMTSAVIKDEIGNSIGLVGIARDITERKQTEHTLRKSEEKYRYLFNESVAAIYVFDTQKHFLDSNQAGLDLLGYSREELLSLSIPDVDADPVVVAPKHKELLSGESIIGFEHQLRRKDGTIITVLNNSKPLTNEIGEVVGLQSTLIDITERKRAEEVLRESMKVFETMLDAVPTVAVQGFDSDGTIRYWNKTNEDIYGYTVEEALGKNVVDLIIPPEMRTVVQDVIRRGAETGIMPPPEELLLMRKDGSRVLVHSSHPVVPFPDGTFRLFCVDVNLSVLKETEEALTESEDRYQEMFNAVMEGIGFVDENEIIRYANPAFVKIFGEKSVEDILGKKLLGYFAESQKNIIFLETNKRKSGESSQYEVEMTTTKGVKKNLSVYVTPRFNKNKKYIGAFGTVLDITERKQAEVALKKSEERFRDLAELLPQTLFEIDIKGNVTYTNRMGLETFGFNSNDLDKGLNVLNLFIPEDYERLTINIEKSLKSETYENHEYTAVTKDGKQFYVLIYGSPILHNGEAIGLRGILLDITSMKEAEVAIRESEQRYRELADSLPQSIFEIDTDGNILFFNQAGCDNFGYTREELEKSVNAIDVFIPEERERLVRNIKKDLVGDKIEDREYTALNKNGTTFQVYAYSNPIIREGKPVGLRGVLVDLTPIKKAEKAIAESEEKYRLLVNNVSAIISLVDYDGIFHFVNKLAATRLSKSVEDIIGKKMWDLFPHEIAERQMRSIREAIDSRKELRRETRSFVNEEWHWYDTVIQPYDFDLDNKKMAIIISHDTTERKTAEEALKSSEEKFRYLAEYSFQGIFIIQNNRIVFSNQKGADIIGMSIEDLCKMDFIDFLKAGLVPEYRDLVIERYRARVVGEDVISNYEFEIYTPSKEKRWLEIYSQKCEIDGINSIYVLLNDITATKQATKALRSSEEKFRSFAEHSLQGVYIVQKNKFTFVNQKAAEITGIPVEKYMNMDVNDFFSRLNFEDQEIAHKKYKERMEGDIKEIRIEMEYKTPNGEKKWLEFFSKKTIIDGQDAQYGIIMDITLRKKAEQDIRKAQRERYNTIREIAGGVSHEMYNALYPAMVALDKLKNNISNDELTNKQKNHLYDMTENAVSRAISMTEVVTRYSRIESEKKFEIVDVNSLISEIIENHKSKIEELQIDVSLNLNDQIKYLCYKNHAFSVFNNLIINALDALSEVDERKIVIKSDKDNKYFKISIYDSGGGIDSEHISKIFDPFYSTKPHTGTGLGLAMVKKIIDIYDGKITVNSGLDKGTEFIIFLKMSTHIES